MGCGDVRTGFKAVVTTEAWRAVAFAAILAAWGELAARIDGKVAVEAISGEASVSCESARGQKSGIIPWRAVFGPILEER